MAPHKKPLTKQQIFTRVAKHLMKQGRQSLDDDGMCMYRGVDDTKCAVGCLIPDSEYDTSFEGQTVRSLNEYRDLEKAAPPAALARLLPAAGLTEETVPLARCLQVIHDRHRAHHWRDQLIDLAKKEGLRLPRELR